MTNSTANLETIRKSYAGIFASLERTCAYFGVEYYLVGPRSVDIQTQNITGLNNTGSGIDFVIVMNDQSSWNKIIQYLTQKEHFYQEKNNSHQFYLRGTRVNLSEGKNDLPADR